MSMVSALEGERNSLTSFVSFDADNGDDSLVELEAHGRITVSLFKSLVEDKIGLRTNGSVGNAKLWFAPRTVGGMPLVSVGEIIIDGKLPLGEIRNRIMDLPRKGDWDPEFLVAKEIKMSFIDESTKLRTCWSACKSKPGIAGRDFVYHAFSVLEQDSWIVACWSADIDEVPVNYRPKAQSAVHVRAKLILGGFYVRRNLDSQWLVSYVNQVDLGLSSWLTDPALKKNPSLLNNLKTVLEKECIVNS
jgi:hypothetical protein